MLPGGKGLYLAAANLKEVWQGDGVVVRIEGRALTPGRPDNPHPHTIMWQIKFNIIDDRADIPKKRS
jgi:hypothetical protein